jgi:putative endonuclease
VEYSKEPGAVTLRLSKGDSPRQNMKNNYWVYIVLCNDKSYYTGVTNNIELRFWQHNNDENKIHYTYSRRPVKLVYSELFHNINDAIAREKQIKGWSRKKKEALIKENYNKLPKLAKGRKGYMKRKSQF